jgi:hypothetical protein
MIDRHGTFHADLAAAREHEDLIGSGIVDKNPGEYHRRLRHYNARLAAFEREHPNATLEESAAHMERWDPTYCGVLRADWAGPATGEP